MGWASADAHVNRGGSFDALKVQSRTAGESRARILVMILIVDVWR